MNSLVLFTQLSSVDQQVRFWKYLKIIFIKVCYNLVHSNEKLQVNCESVFCGLLTEHRLQAQCSELCARLGHSVLPVSLALFSAGTVTQFELDQVQSATTLYQQAQKLLTICLSKGESACMAFYSALDREDENLADEIRST